MRVSTNAYDMLVTYEAEAKVARVFHDNYTIEKLPELSDVEDDSSWEEYEDVEDIEEWLGVYDERPDWRSVIVEEIEFE